MKVVYIFLFSYLELTLFQNFDLISGNLWMCVVVIETSTSIFL